MSAAQAHTVVGDVAAIAQALVILDRRYHVTPGWEDLEQGLRLGWAALAAAIDVSLGPPDYTIDKLGWRPATKPIAGPEKPGILGVLQAEHNLVVHMNVFPRAANLRFVIESQRFVSRRLLPFARRTDPRVALRWEQRAQTYGHLRAHFREIGGRIGHGAMAAAEGGNAVRRLRVLPPDTIVEPKVLAGFQILFDALDQRIADVVNEGIDRYAYFKRITLPELDLTSGQLVSPARIGFVPLDRAGNKNLIHLIHHQLRPSIDLQPTHPGANRADFHAALTHRTPGGRNVERSQL